MKSAIHLFFLSLLVVQSSAFAEDAPTVLARLLLEKGAITASEFARIESASTHDRVALLATMLEAKGVLSNTEVAQITGAPREGMATEARLIPAVYTTTPLGAAPAQAPASQSRPTIQAPEAPPVTSQNKFPVTLYGMLLVNAFYDTALTNIQDVPLLAAKQGSDALGNDKSFGMTARQSRLGLKYQGGEVAGAKLSGLVEMDFFGGKAALGNGINMDLLRLRLAYGRLDWTNVAFEAGQDWSVFAPLNPTSLASYAIPAMSGSGNPWIRSPQFRAELHNSLTGTNVAQLQVAATDPDVGDYQTAQFLTVRTPAIGERGRMPAIDTRLALTNRSTGRDFTFGLSAHYGRGKNAGAIGALNFQRPVDSWGVAVDYSLPITRKFLLTGEAYEGRALGIFSVSTGESVLPIGTPGEHGVESRGGWIQAQYNFTPRWQTNISYGLDAQNVNNLRVGDRDKNQTYMANLLFKLSPSVTFAWEYRRFLTHFKNQRASNENGDQANLAVLYTF
jgi:hypothetical protein